MWRSCWKWTIKKTKISQSYNDRKTSLEFPEMFNKYRSTINKRTIDIVMIKTRKLALIYRDLRKAKGAINNRNGLSRTKNIWRSCSYEKRGKILKLLGKDRNGSKRSFHKRKSEDVRETLFLVVHYEQHWSCLIVGLVRKQKKMKEIKRNSSYDRQIYTRNV